MTRDDYKVKDTMIFEESQEGSINSIIDNIFDDFESRTCENCKFGMTYHFDDKIECIKIEADTQGMYFSNDFCCNKWEVIDEK